VVLFTLLNVTSFMRTSATWDEPQHLAAGYAALAARDFRVDPEHPPLVRLWAALPVRLMRGGVLDTAAIDATTPTEWVTRPLFVFSHHLLYVEGDADRQLYAARFMIVLLGLVLGALVFFWTREWLGPGPAVAALAAYTLEPNIAAHASLVTTDLGVTCFVFAAVYSLWRLCRNPTPMNASAFVLSFVAAQLTKFSAVLLGPIVVVLLGIAVVGTRALRWRTAIWIAVAAALATLAAVWLVYDLRYAPSGNAAWLFRFQDDPVVRQRLPSLAAIVGWIDGHRLLPNAFSQGFLLGQAKAQSREAFLAGRYSMTGWWYYFPLAFLIKTPSPLVLLSAGGIAVCVGRRASLGAANVAFVVIPVVAFMTLAMATPLNIGLRHLLPIYPFCILLAAAAVTALSSSGRGRLVLAVATAAWALEFGRVYPHNLAFFNQLVGGPANGHRYLVDSNLDWGQDLKGLKGWMTERGVDQVALAYFGSADPSYYRIRYTPLPDTGLFAGGPLVPPRVPGWFAVSATILSGAYGDDRSRAFYQPLRDRQPSAAIGYSIHLYWIERPWW
jgi:4-amino-4-deoxy-L-arabinose transferase-like glycosyltransferase